MDDIERLMRSADPAAESGGPGPLRLDAPVPVFSQARNPGHPESSVRKSRPRRNGWRFAVAGMVVAAVATGAIVLSSPLNSPSPNPGPAAPVAPEPADPSQSSSDVRPPLGPNGSGLPHGLVPAYPGVAFGDSAACKALDPAKIEVTRLDGSIASLPGEAADHPVIGCLDNMATFLVSEAGRAVANEQGLPEGILLARWKGGTWRIDVAANHGPTDGPVRSWPQLRAETGAGGADTETWMKAQLSDLGIKPAQAATLMGPNLPSWMVEAKPLEFITSGSGALEVTYPHYAGSDSWMWEETNTDDSGAQMDFKAEFGESASHTTRMFDAAGKQVFSFSSRKPGILQQATCADPEATYRFDGVAPSATVVDGGVLELALITVTGSNGVVFPELGSTPGLFPAGTPTTGRYCDLPREIPFNGRMLEVGRWMAPMAFKDAAERKAYLESSEYKMAVTVAAKLVLSPM